MTSTMGIGRSARTRKIAPKRRLPIEAVTRLRSHPVTSIKCEKSYNRKKLKEQMRKIIRENTIEDNH